MRNEPIYLIQDESGRLHGYWDETILRIDLHRNRGEIVKLYELVGGFTVQYRPLSVDLFLQRTA
jgi:hypothetical protein